jgi:hypothetical protein
MMLSLIVVTGLLFSTIISIPESWKFFRGTIQVVILIQPSFGLKQLGELNDTKNRVCAGQHAFAAI